jgi:hypothetical protein
MFKLAEPEHIVIPIPMTREKWFSLAARNNTLRSYSWPNWKTEEVYADLFKATKV